MGMFDVFGFEIKKKKAPEVKSGSVITPASDDGSTIVSSGAAYYGLVIDIEGHIKNENELIRRYRESSQYADCDAAIEDIVNEAIIAEDDKPIVTVVLDDAKVSDSIKTKIRDEFETVLRLYKFDEKAHDIFRQWYIDGRAFYHIILDPENPTTGIQEIRPVDPRKIRRIKNVKKERNPQGVEVNKVIEEYYLYNDRGITEQTTQGVKLSLDSIILATSGLLDSNSNMILSHLHKAIKPVNQLKMMEDALVIYRISRAPERRIFYIDVGNLPKQRAEQYVTEIMNKFRNKVVYDASTGEVKDSRQHLSLMEDFWMPRREGGKGTEITTLAGGQNLGQIEDIQYFQTKLYQALNVPLSRLQPQQGFSLGRASEITREEIKFNKFIERLRKRFSVLLRDALRVQLIAKKIIREEEWEELSYNIRYDFQRDNHFTELKEAELINNRISILQAVDPYVGKYYSTSWVRTHILHQTEDEIKDMDKEILDDRKDQLDFASHEGEVEATRQQPVFDQQLAADKAKSK
jgi:hypothetical protein